MLSLMLSCKRKNQGEASRERSFPPFLLPQENAEVRMTALPSFRFCGGDAVPVEDRGIDLVGKDARGIKFVKHAEIDLRQCDAPAIL